MGEFFRAIRMLFTLDCAKASRLTSDSRERPLGRGERLALKAHLGFCAACRRMRRRIVELRDAARGLPPTQQGSELRLSDEAKERIELRMRDALREHEPDGRD